jgi:hypothetical protein
MVPALEFLTHVIDQTKQLVLLIYPLSFVDCNVALLHSISRLIIVAVYPSSVLPQGLLRHETT